MERTGGRFPRRLMVMFWTRLRLWWTLVSIVDSGWRRLGRPEPGEVCTRSLSSSLRFVFLGLGHLVYSWLFETGKGVSGLGEVTSG